MRHPATAVLLLALGAGGCATTGAAADDPPAAVPAQAPERGPAASPAPTPAAAAETPEAPAPTPDEVPAEVADSAERVLASLPPAEAVGLDARRAWVQGLHRADALLASGDLEGARTVWRAMAKPFAGEPFGEAPDYVRDARIRFTFVGRKPPPIGPTEALGGDPVTWESLRGRIVVAHSFWTYCNPCRTTMLALDDLAARHGNRVTVIGLAAFVPFGQDGGRIPESRENMHDPVHFVEVPDRDALREHLVAFRTVTGLSYPWLIQDTPQYVRWQIPENHPILLVGRDGVVAMAVRGPELEPLEATLRTLLARH